MSKRPVKRVKRGSSPGPAAFVHPDVTEDDVARAAGMVPGLTVLAGTVRHILPEGRDEMDVAMAEGTEASLHDAIIAVWNTTIGNTNPKLAALGVAALRYSGLYENIVKVSLLALGRTRIDLGDNLRFVTGKMLSKESIERFKSDEVSAMIDRICNVDGVTFIPLGSWALDSQVKYEWNKFVKGGSAYAYREATARAAVRNEVKRVVEAVAESYFVWGLMLEAHIGRCFIGADDDEYDEDGHYREPEVYDTDDYNSENEYVGNNDEEADGDRNW